MFSGWKPEDQYKQYKLCTLIAELLKQLTVRSNFKRKRQYQHTNYNWYYSGNSVFKTEQNIKGELSSMCENSDYTGNWCKQSAFFIIIKYHLETNNDKLNFVAHLTHGS